MVAIGIPFLFVLFWVDMRSSVFPILFLGVTRTPVDVVMIEGITNTLFIWTVTSIPIPSTHIQQASQSHTPFAHIQRDHSVILLIIERIQIHRDGLQLHELPLLGENAQMKRHGGLSRRPVKVVVKLRE